MKLMVGSLLAAAAVVAASAFAGPAVPQYKFAFVVQSEHQPLVRIDAALPPGTVQSFQATQHLRIEVEVPASNNDQSRTLVRLIDSSTGEAVALHSAETSGSVAVAREYAYLVCDRRVTFYSGLPAAAPQCGQ